ncbi:MAG: DoxX family membrane protein [Flavobacterium sp.]|uniref:DoxX family membrane protein n=1 Tax=Flavobacterium sp. TaxID=239 RepID=UPI0026336F1C|nr:DoxX family membrane protein [Flavobacterium sp.]MDD5150049.1 DoxX family membrane protein [Flavobacterium sp.]
MKITTLIVRLLIGLLLLFASLSYFFKFGEHPNPVGDMKTVMDGFMATKYILPVAKSVELLCGLSFLTGKFIKISAIILVPISLNILLINVFLMPEGTPIAAALFLGNLFLIYTNW